MEPAAQQLAEVFGRCVGHDASAIKAATAQLEGLAKQPGYGITVLKVRVASRGSTSLSSLSSFVADIKRRGRAPPLSHQASCLTSPPRAPTSPLSSDPAKQVIAAGDALGLDVRLAAAVNFKNLVKFCWVRERVVHRCRASASDEARAPLRGPSVALCRPRPRDTQTNTPPSSTHKTHQKNHSAPPSARSTRASAPSPTTKRQPCALCSPA